ncbi:MAG: hypothetical protein N2C12_11010 [Planctomycetales bacterium]
MGNEAVIIGVRRCPSTHWQVRESLLSIQNGYVVVWNCLHHVERDEATHTVANSTCMSYFLHAERDEDYG